jgi:hypothetical protein
VSGSFECDWTKKVLLFNYHVKLSYEEENLTKQAEELWVLEELCIKKEANKKDLKKYQMH